MTPADAAKALLAAIAEVTGSETKARAILADIPSAAQIVALLPARGRGRPRSKKTTLDHLHMLTAYDLKMAVGGLGASVRGVARYLHKHEGIGASDASVERTLHRLLKGQQRAGSRNRRT
ncbi:MAG TPA: hypothetical protein VN802_10825 [Stellaceae bacterium]|nr:hypothetical protein [Stellaceae bacterium]